MKTSIAYGDHVEVDPAARPLKHCPACGSSWSGSRVENESHDGPHAGCVIAGKHVHQSCSLTFCKTVWTARLVLRRRRADPLMGLVVVAFAMLAGFGLGLVTRWVW